MKPYYEHAGITIYHGDCRAILPDIGMCHAILTDPPYGIDMDVRRYNDHSTKHETFVGDESAMDFSFLFTVGLVQIVWGANNWPQQLPFNPKRDGWICWDKRTNETADRILGSPFELACVIGGRYYEIFRLQHGGAINADSINGNGDLRFHPTQKPIRLMQRIIGRFFPKQIVCDPFMGSGTTLIAAKNLGQCAIGIEIEEKYCEIAAKRLSQEVLDFK